MNPFLKSESDDVRQLMENLGATVYYAQLLEDSLRLILTGGELLGLVSFERNKDLRIKEDDEDLWKACLGPMKKIIEKHRQTHDDKDLIDMLEKANQSRNCVVHRFLTERATDLGQRIVEDDFVIGESEIFSPAVGGLHGNVDQGQLTCGRGD